MSVERGKIKEGQTRVLAAWSGFPSRSLGDFEVCVVNTSTVFQERKVGGDLLTDSTTSITIYAKSLAPSQCPALTQARTSSHPPAKTAPTKSPKSEKKQANNL